MENIIEMKFTLNDDLTTMRGEITTDSGEYIELPYIIFDDLKKSFMYTEKFVDIHLNGTVLATFDKEDRYDYYCKVKVIEKSK